jgi:hypothetical protein
MTDRQPVLDEGGGVEAEVQTSDTPIPPLSAIADAKAEVSGLVNDVRAYVVAERALWTGRAAFTGKTLKSISILSVILSGLIIGALNVLILGGLLILSAFFGPIAATLIILGCVLLVITIIAFIVMRKAKLLKFNSTNRDNLAQ